jgi:hypothetical protein
LENWDVDIAHPEYHFGGTRCEAQIIIGWWDMCVQKKKMWVKSHNLNIIFSSCLSFSKNPHTIIWVPMCPLCFTSNQFAWNRLLFCCAKIRMHYSDSDVTTLGNFLSFLLVLVGPACIALTLCHCVVCF